MNTNKLLLLAITILISKPALGFGHLASTAKRYGVIAGTAIAYHQTNKQIRLQKSEKLNQSEHDNLEQIPKELAARPVLKSFEKERDLHFLINCFNQNPALFGQEYYFNETDIEYLTSHGNTVILFVDGAPAGFGTYSYDFVDYLGIDQKYRGRGYSKILLDHMVKKISNNDVKEIGLSVARQYRHSN